ncbi:MAG: hypothetical protein ACYC4U_26480 [Pirellulaceae bacterium]
MTRACLLVLSLCGLAYAGAQELPYAEAQEDAANPTPDTAQVPVASDSLSVAQNQVADKYRRLEDLIFKMADFEATSNPRRAALLKQAYKQSKDRLTQSQLNAVVALLAQKQYKRALDGQEVAQKDLQELLQLLLSEDRSDRLKTETQRIMETIKELKRLQRLQRSVRGQTEGGADPQQLAQKQAQVAERTGELAKQLEEADAQATDQATPAAPTPAGEDAPPEGQTPEKASEPPAEQQSPGDEPDTDTDTDTDKNENKQPNPTPTTDDPPPNTPGEQSPAEQSPAEQSPAEPSPGAEPQEGQPAPQPTPPPQPGAPGEPAEPGQGKNDEAPPQPPEPSPEDPSPAKKRVREAEQKMREAQQNLEQAKRSESVEKQTEALQKLDEAIAELEEVLRQAREEEMERVLALLEGRFRQMLEEEIKIYEATQRLDQTSEQERGRNFDIRANKLAFDQRKVAGQADRCLTLLLDEGSSIAFPEVVEQIRDDMESVSDRLAESKVGTITQDMEQEIIASLEEMVAAFQQAQQDLENQQPPQPGEPGENAEQPLVDALAELKMIRSLQMRVNLRTQRYAKLLDDADDPVGQAASDDLRRALGELGERQASIQRITRDIVLGKNR